MSVYSYVSLCEMMLLLVLDVVIATAKQLIHPGDLFEVISQRRNGGTS